MIKLSHVCKAYPRGNSTVVALDDINLEIEKGEFVAITGSSGSGKSTLISIIGCLDSPDGGQYHFSGKSISASTEDALAQLRNRHIGFVFQFFNLIPRFDARRNVELPMMYAGLPEDLREQRAVLALRAVGLGDRLDHTPAQLSGGQQQRVAIARALVNNPELIIADEPTGALDSKTAHEILAMFKQLNAGGKTIIIVTHDMEIAHAAKRVISMRDGKIVSDYRL